MAGFNGMNDASESFELPVNKRLVGELVSDPETDEVRLSIDGRLLSLRSLGESLACFEGFRLAIEVIDSDQ